MNEVISWSCSPDPPSAWWWLLSPVMYALRRRWNNVFWEFIFAQPPGRAGRSSSTTAGAEPAPAAE